MNELETVETVVDSSNNVDITVSGRGEVSTEIDNALDISVVKKEYKIVGDDVFIPTLYDDAPQWMKDLVQLAVDNAMTVDKELLLNELISRLNDFATSYVPLNQYTQSILDLSNATESIHAFIETLNSNYNDGINNANAQIIELKHTKASSEEVVAKTIETLAAQLLTPSSQLGAVVAELREAVATTSSASAGIITNVNAKLANLDGDIQATANATTYLRSYVGIDDTGTATGTGLLANVEILQKQADGVINTYSDIYDVMLGIEDSNNNTDNDQLVMTAEPYASWLAEDTLNGNENVRLAHIGDVYIKYSNTTTGGKEYIASYKFIKTTVDTTSPYATDAEGFTWALIIDQAAQDAYQQALNARDLADDKRRVFVGLGDTTTPSVPYDQGDLWLIDVKRTVNGVTYNEGDILRCVETKGEIGVYEQNDWVLASSYANAVDAQNQQFQEFVTNDYTVFATNIQSQVDKKAETFYQNSVPTGRIKATNVPDNVTLNAYVGDLWKNIYEGTISGYLGNNTEYIYTKTANGSNWDYDWVKMEVPDIVYDTIDTKKSIYSGNTVPDPVPPDVIKVNDIWIPSDNVAITTKADCDLAGGSWDGTVCSITKFTKGEIYQFSNTSKWLIATTYSETLEAVNNSLQSQIDGKIDTYYQATVPTGMTALNNGDYWYCTADISSYKKGKVYKYVHSTTSWEETADVSRYAFDTANGKASIFSSTNLPTSGYKINDMLIVIGSFSNGTTTFADGVVLSSTANRTSGFTHADWVKRINDTEDLDKFKTTTYNPTVASLQSQVDGQVNYYFYDSSIGQTAASVSGSASWTTDTLKKEHNGDIAYNTYTKKGYWYDRNASNWVEITGAQNAGLIEALNKAAEARAVADEKVAVYFAIEQSTAPAAPGTTVDTIGGKAIVVPFYWYDTTNLVLKSYVASAWTAVPMTAANDGDQMQSMVVNTTKHTVDYYTREYSDASTPKWIVRTPNGYVASSAWGVNLDAYLKDPDSGEFGGSSALSTEVKTTSNGTVETAFAYNSSTKAIGGQYHTAGFGLKTLSGVGTEVDPYVSEFWVNANKFRVSDGTQGLSVFSIDGNNVVFNGKVSFTDVTRAPTVTQHSTFPGVSIGAGGYTVTKPGIHVIYLYSTGATGLTIKANSTTIGTIASLNKQVYIFATPALPAGQVVTVTVANGTTVAYISNPDEIKATVPETQWYIPAYNTTLVAESNGQFVIGSSSTAGNIIKDINGTTNTTTIDGGKITTRSITADQIAANTITADRLTSTTGQSSVWTGGGLVSQNFDGNVVGGIGSPTKGFRLSSNAAGTSVDPTIYGGYIKGGTIDGATLVGGVLSISDFKVKSQSYPANTGRFQLEFETVTKGSSTVDSPVFIGQAASPGHSLSRMCLDSQVFRYYASCDAFFTTNTTTVYVSVDGGAWAVVATATSTQGSGVAGTYVHTNSGSATVQFRFTTTSGDNMSHAVNRFRVVSDNFI